MYLAPVDRFKRIFLFSVVMAILFGATFLTTYLIKMNSDSVKNKYENAVCTSIENSYPPDQLVQVSLDSWLDYYKSNKGEITPDKISPIIQCFCEQQYKKLGS
jgi:hypothetical protein